MGRSGGFSVQFTAEHGIDITLTMRTLLRNLWAAC